MAFSQELTGEVSAHHPLEQHYRDMYRAHVASAEPAPPTPAPAPVRAAGGAASGVAPGAPAIITDGGVSMEATTGLARWPVHDTSEIALTQ